MALLKSDYINQYGSPTQYWKITGLNINVTNKYCEVQLSGFLSQEARESNMTPIERRVVRPMFTEGKFDEYFSAPVLETNSVYIKAYQFARLDPFFTDCVDI